MNSFLRQPYQQFKSTPYVPSTNGPRFEPLAEMWPSKKRSKKKNKSRPAPPAPPAPPIPPPPPAPTPKKKQRGWGKRNKNKPENPDDVSILDAGWNSPVKLLDPRRGAPAPPKDSVLRFKTGWGGTTAAEAIPVFVRKGPFPLLKLPIELQLKVVEFTLQRGGSEYWEIWEGSRHIRDLCERAEVSRNSREGNMGF